MLYKSWRTDRFCYDIWIGKLVGNREAGKWRKRIQKWKKINNRKMEKEDGKGTMDAIFLLDVKKILPVIEWKEYFLKSFLIYWTDK